jgi:hypothetical protein
MIQDHDRSMVPKALLYIEFQREAYRRHSGWHRERHAYAQARYRQLAGAECPVAAGIRHGKAHHSHLAAVLGISVDEAKQLDHNVRLTIAQELGHERIEITNKYLG